MDVEAKPGSCWENLLQSFDKILKGKWGGAKRGNVIANKETFFVGQAYLILL